MESHPLNRVHHKENSSPSSKIDPHADALNMTHDVIAKVKHTSLPENRDAYETALSPELQKLFAAAKARYEEYMPVAEKWDDAQEKFCSTAANTLKANELIAKIALRSKQIAKIS